MFKFLPVAIIAFRYPRTTVDPDREPIWRLAIGGLIAAHVLADLVAWQVAAVVSGTQDREPALPVLLGLALGQASLLGFFLVWGMCNAWCRWLIVLPAAFLPATVAGDALGPPRLGGAFVFCLAPLATAALLAMALRSRGFGFGRVGCVAQAPATEPLQFTLRAIFAATSLVAILLGLARVARAALDVAWTAILLFGWLPLSGALVLQPLVALWATLGPRRAGLRSTALLAVSLVCGLGYPFIAKAEPELYWMIAGLLFVQALVLGASLLIVRGASYRLVR
ncbi:MAG TPA: hypothetical protein VMV69_06470 [Pirellulales bacterium]|nr:hypothetical protein [Pirellulales bacterium]